MKIIGKVFLLAGMMLPLSGCSVDRTAFSLSVGSIAAFANGSDPDTRIWKVENEIFPGALLKGQEFSPQTLLQRMQVYKVPGVSIAIINHGRIEWARGYGYKENGSNEKVTPNTLFQAASISKSVSAVAALQLADAHLVDLDYAANAYLKTWTIRENVFTQKAPVTLRRILSHTAGFNIHGFDGYAIDHTLPTLSQILDGIAPANSPAIEVEAVPGTEFRYSGGGYVVMQQLVQDVSGQDLASYANQHVLQRAGMSHSTFTQPLPDTWKSFASAGHDNDGMAIDGKWNTYPEIGAAGLWTTPTDLARFAMEIQKGVQGQSNLLSKNMIDQYLTPTTLEQYGLGVGIKGVGNSAKFWHTGGNAGFRCIMTAYAHEGTGAIVMTNGDGGSFLMTEIQAAIARAYEWDDYQPQVYTPLADQDPKVKDIVQTGIKFLEKGQMDPENFSVNFKTKLTNDMLDQYKWLFSSLGSIRSITLVAKKSSGQITNYDYWVEFNHAIALLHATMTEDQKVENLLPDNVFQKSE